MTEINGNWIEEKDLLTEIWFGSKDKERLGKKSFVEKSCFESLLLLLDGDLFENSIKINLILNYVRTSKTSILIFQNGW